MRTPFVLPLLVAAACAVEDKVPGTVEGEPDPGPTTNAALNVSVAVVDKTGERVELNTFADARDVYFALRIADPAKPVVAEDYVFQVVGTGGVVLSSDAFGCRQFHVDARGLIDRVHTGISAAGTVCQHAFARTADNKLVIELMPFTEGGERFTLNVASAATSASDAAFTTSITVPFAVRPVPPPPEEEEPPPEEEEPPPEEPPPEEPPPEEPPPEEPPDDDDDNPGMGKGKDK